jgi:hypothetical protein
MRIMAIGACHLAFRYRVMRRLADLRALLLVAGEAQSAFVAYGVCEWNCGMVQAIAP